MNECGLEEDDHMACRDIEVNLPYIQYIVRIYSKKFTVLILRIYLFLGKDVRLLTYSNINEENWNKLHIFEICAGHLRSRSAVEWRVKFAVEETGSWSEIGRAWSLAWKLGRQGRIGWRDRRTGGRRTGQGRAGQTCCQLGKKRKLEISQCAATSCLLSPLLSTPFLSSLVQPAVHAVRDAFRDAT